MNRLLLTAAVLAVASLSACEKATVVAVPAPTVAVPGPAGPPGATGETGAPGKTGDGTTVIVAPPAAAASGN